MSNLGWVSFLTKKILELNWVSNSEFVIFFLQKIENVWKCFAKISVTKFQKWKIWDCHRLRCSMLFLIVNSVFSVDTFFMEKIVKQNRLFWLFWKNAKKGERYGAKQGEKIEKKISQSHPSSSAVWASRFGPPNFFHRPPESGLISHTSCII